MRGKDVGLDEGGSDGTAMVIVVEMMRMLVLLLTGSLGVRSL